MDHTAIGHPRVMAATVMGCGYGMAPHSRRPRVKGQLVLPVGGQQNCPSMANRTAR